MEYRPHYSLLYIAALYLALAPFLSAARYATAQSEVQSAASGTPAAVAEAPYVLVSSTTVEYLGVYTKNHWKDLPLILAALLLAGYGASLLISRRRSARRGPITRFP